MSYNFKVWNFGNGKKQIRIYNNSIKTDFEREKEENEEDEDLDFNPFSGQYEKVEREKIKDESRSNLVSNNRAKQKIYELARSNHWEYFLTLTFAEDRYNYELLTEKLRNWINRTKKNYSPDMKYIFVPELHKDGALHFHGIVSNIGNLPLKDSGHKDNGNIIYNIDCYKMGFTTATKVTDSGRVASYMTKYITKDLMSYSKGKKKYWASKNLTKPCITDYHITDEEIQDFIMRNLDITTYTKTIDNPLSHTKIRILEIDENML